MATHRPFKPFWPISSAGDFDRATQMIDAVDFLGFQGTKRQAAYKKMIQTGIHWRVHEKK